MVTQRETRNGGMCLNRKKNAAPAPRPGAIPGGLGWEVTGSGVTITKYRGTATTLVIPAAINGLSVTEIGNGAFAACAGLRSVTLPSSVTHIRDYAFFACAGLRSVTVPVSVITIGESAFLQCTGLRSVMIPGSVTSMGNYVFAGCAGLRSVTIPGSVTHLGDYAFFECAGLAAITLSRRTRVGDEALPDGARLTYSD